MTSPQERQKICLLVHNSFIYDNGKMNLLSNILSIEEAEENEVSSLLARDSRLPAIFA